MDVGKSFIFFWLIIGPTLYKTYYKREDILRIEDVHKGAPDEKDSFAELLRKIKRAEQQEAAKAAAKAESDAADVDRVVSEEEPLVTFADYERLM